MDEFIVQLARAAIDDLEEIPKAFRDQVISEIKSLSINPLPRGSGIKKLKGFKPPLYRLRSGDYRVLYRLQSHTITIMRIINRKDLEKIIKRANL